MKRYPNKEIQIINVHAIYDGTKKVFYPKVVAWKSSKYVVTKLAYHHKFKVGDTWNHVFSLMSENKFMKIVMNGKTLEWVLQEFIDEQIQ